MVPGPDASSIATVRALDGRWRLASLSLSLSMSASRMAPGPDGANIPAGLPSRGRRRQAPLSRSLCFRVKDQNRNLLRDR